MATYKVEVIETLSRIITIDAEKLEAALAEVEDRYFTDDEIVLDAEDFMDVESRPYVDNSESKFAELDAMFR